MKLLTVAINLHTLTLEKREEVLIPHEEVAGDKHKIAVHACCLIMIFCHQLQNSLHGESLHQVKSRSKLVKDKSADISVTLQDFVPGHLLREFPATLPAPSVLVDYGSLWHSKEMQDVSLLLKSQQA